MSSDVEFSSSSCFASERAALLSFKSGITDDPMNRLGSWSGHDCCLWHGVMCSNTTGHVFKLDLRNNYVEDDYWAYDDDTILNHNFSMLRGQISNSLLDLPHLRHLDLSGNLLGGVPIPAFLGSLKCLRYLNLSCMNFVGRVPPQLGNLSELVYLDINSFMNFGNYYVHSPGISWLAQLTSLKHLDLGGVNLSAAVDWVHVVNILPNLRYLNLSNMGFVGRVPPQLGNLSKLVYLDINSQMNFGNHVHSPEMSWLAQLTSLKHLDMGRVNLSAPVDWVHVVNALSNLRVLRLEWCGIVNSAPSLLHLNLTALEELNLSWNSLNNQVTSNLFWDVTSLKSLELYDCGLFGSFPNELGNMTSLETLGLGFNHLHGMIPATFQNLCNLKYLDLSSNDIGMDITYLMERLPNCPQRKLQQLKLYDANLAGNITYCLPYLTGLSNLDLAWNHLSGSVPVGIGALTNLTSLDLSGNSLSGVISQDHFANLTNLEYINLSDLEFKVDFDWVPPFQLSTAEFASCHMGPGFPKWLQSQKHIDLLYISNSLTGTIPDWFWIVFSNVTVLDISNNNISGDLPPNLDFMSLEYLFLQSNNLTGSVPQLPKTIRILDISNNILDGHLSLNFEAPWLQVVHLFSNHLTGVIPESICRWKQLRRLDLSKNLLERNLPDCSTNDLKQWDSSTINPPTLNSSSVISSNLQLQALLLGDNNLSGEFPLFLQICKNLTVLDLSHNNFSGKLPAWISDELPHLVILRLRSNSFSGRIPVEITKLPALRFLDLANNTLSGTIPRSLVLLRALTASTALDPRQNPFVMEYDNSDSSFMPFGLANDSFPVQTKGEELKYTGNIIYLMSIDLSQNNLAGPIPREISSLVGLKNLNLSWNHFSGHIPEQICALQLLESLDLSDNQISGEIPSCLSNLTSLSFLNMSYNNLSGRIPCGNQLDTLNTDDPASMYIGNPGLCGHPLQNQCPGDQPTERGPILHHKNGWPEMDLCLGYIVGFVVGLAFLVFFIFNFFKLFETLYHRVFLL